MPSSKHVVMQMQVKTSLSTRCISRWRRGSIAVVVRPVAASWWTSCKKEYTYKYGCKKRKNNQFNLNMYFMCVCYACMFMYGHFIYLCIAHNATFTLSHRGIKSTLLYSSRLSCKIIHGRIYKSRLYDNNIIDFLCMCTLT